MSIRFDGRVAIVTGAGGGLGRSHALELAKRGAKVVVNDLGGALDGTGGSSQAAEKVVAEIKAQGGQAIANGSSVTDEKGVANLAEQTLKAFGRIDILINNAGILRDKTFSKMEMKDFEAVVDTHLIGSVMVSKACWATMRDQKYGRIVMTTSPTGLFGTFGQTNYGTAKLGLVGFMGSLKLEGERDNIRVNTICPLAHTRMTEGIETLSTYKPEYCTAGVMCLVDDEAPNGTILPSAGGVLTAVRLVESEGIALPRESLTPELIRTNWAKITDFTRAHTYQSGGEQVARIDAMVLGKK